jgi:hypothetical protein
MHYVYWHKFCTEQPSSWRSGKTLDRGGMAQIVHKYRKHLKTLGARRVTRNKIHIEDPQMLGASEQNQVATETWRPKFYVSRELGD